ncbi:MAG: CGNR zinc finger domain-containing protein [Streptosporangiales bacterium]|nr:CGNR zinc finger domain-containing protein [Streptosporangiales bacterium]
MDFNSHMDAVVRVTVDLVNVATPGEARGRPYPLPAGDALLDAVAGALAATSSPNRRQTAPDRADVDDLVALAARLRTVFEAVAAADLDTAAGTVNRLLADSGARPELSKHDGEPWHLHFHGTDGSLVGGWTASCATGLAVVLGGEYAERLGICSAPSCDRAYVDTSRRFCSTACQSRVKAAAYRERRQT